LLSGSILEMVLDLLCVAVEFLDCITEESIQVIDYFVDAKE